MIFPSISSRRLRNGSRSLTGVTRTLIGSTRRIRPPQRDTNPFAPSRRPSVASSPAKARERAARPRDAIDASRAHETREAQPTSAAPTPLLRQAASVTRSCTRCSTDQARGSHAASWPRARPQGPSSASIRDEHRSGVAVARPARARPRARRRRRRRRAAKLEQQLLHGDDDARDVLARRAARRSQPVVVGRRDARRCATWLMRPRSPRERCGSSSTLQASGESLPVTARAIARHRRTRLEQDLLDSASGRRPDDRAAGADRSRPGRITIVRITMLRSTPPSPRSSRSRRSRRRAGRPRAVDDPIVRSFGAPVIEPPGKPRARSDGRGLALEPARTVEISWWTVLGLDDHQLGDPDAVDLADPPEVVAQQVDDHQMLGLGLLVACSSAPAPPPPSGRGAGGCP